MKLQRCNNGHFYNADEYASCPHSMAAAKAASTRGAAPAPSPAESAAREEPGAKKKPKRLPAFTMERAAKTVAEAAEDDEVKTLGFRYADAAGAVSAEKPVVGFLIGTRGKYYGRAFPLYDGRNAIGRGSDMAVPLVKEPSVSRRAQAVLAYDPKVIAFFLLPGESSELCYLNGDALLAGTRLSKNDRISLGKATLMFLPCCDDAFSWLKE